MSSKIVHKVTYPSTLHEWILHLANVPPEADGLIFQFIPIEEDHLALARNYAKYGGYPPWQSRSKSRYGWGSEFQKAMMLAATVEKASSFIEEPQVRTAYVELAEILEPFFDRHREISDNAIRRCQYWNSLLTDGTREMLEMFGFEEEFRMEVYHIPYPLLSRGHTKGGANIPTRAIYVFDSKENIKEAGYYSTLWHEMSHVLMRELTGTKLLGPLGEIIASSISSTLSAKYFLTRSRWQYFLLSKLTLGRKGSLKSFIEQAEKVDVGVEITDKTITLRIEGPDMRLKFTGMTTIEENPYEIRVTDKQILVSYKDSRPLFRLSS